MKLQENFREMMKYHSWPNFVRIKQDTFKTKIEQKFWKIFGELSVNHWQTAADSYLIEYLTILVSHFSQVYPSKLAKIYWFLNLRSIRLLRGPYSFGRTEVNQQNHEVHSCYTIKKNEAKLDKDDLITLNTTPKTSRTC